ncbi:hypothetical protein GCM10020367_09580 [Streptomyces sannanensis]|uniref:FMN-binding negative transcriptional regulator n=1 Tax=Streptomyces sannanensis TaxID=285536 RepID=A0ABP6S5W8_9ACTN
MHRASGRCTVRPGARRLLRRGDHHLARPNPLWPALEADPRVLLSVVDDYVFVPGPWQAPPHMPAEHDTPTGFYAAVQLRCTAHVVDDPAEKADLLNRQVGHFQPEEIRERTAAGLAARGGPNAPEAAARHARRSAWWSASNRSG